MVSIEEFYADEELPDLHDLLEMLSADESMSHERRKTLCNRLIETDELWIVDTYSFYAGIPHIINVAMHDIYGVALPGVSDFIVGSSDELSGALRLCDMLEKKGVVHIYANLMQRQ